MIANEHRHIVKTESPSKMLVRPGATSSVLAASSDGLQPNSDGLHLVASFLLVESFELEFGNKQQRCCR